MNNLPNDFAILVGTPGRLEIDLADWQRRMSDPDVARDLASVDLGSPYKLACSLLVSEDELYRFTGDGPVHTDDRPILDYLTHAGVYDDTLAENVRALLACRTDGRRFVTSRPIGVPRDRFAAIWDRWYRAIGHTLTGHVFWRQGDLESAGEAYRRAGRLVPDDAGIARLAGLPRPASPDSAPPDD